MLMQLFAHYPPFFCGRMLLQPVAVLRKNPPREVGVMAMSGRTRLAVTSGCVAVVAACAAYLYPLLISHKAAVQSAVVPAIDTEAGGCSTVPSDNCAPGSSHSDGGNGALWVFSVGVSHYKDQSLHLKYAADDACFIRAALSQPEQQRIYSAVHSCVLTDKDVTRESIIEKSRSFLGTAGLNDVVVMFLAGHGVPGRTAEDFYFLPYPATDDTKLTAGLSNAELRSIVQDLRGLVSGVVVMVDACNAGAAPGGRATSLAMGPISLGEGVYFLASSKPTEVSRELDSARHGAFTYAVVRGLRGEATPNADGFISVSALFAYASGEVAKLTEGKQHPYQDAKGTDVYLAAIDPTKARAVAGRVTPNTVPSPISLTGDTVAVGDFHSVNVEPEYAKYGGMLRYMLSASMTTFLRKPVMAPDIVDEQKKKRGVDDVQAARDLHIRKLVTGRFGVLGSEIEIYPQITDVPTGRLDPCDSVRGSLAKFSELEEAVKKNVLPQLGIQLSSAAQAAAPEESGSVSAVERLLKSEGRLVDAPPSMGTPRKDEAETAGPRSRLEGNNRAASWVLGLVGRVFQQAAAAYATDVPASTEAAQALRSLEEYRSALEHKDIEQLASLYVALSEQQRENLRAYFDNASDLKVEITEVSVEAHGQDLAVSYTRRDEFIDKETGKPARLSIRLMKILVREGEKWKIEGGA